MIVARKTGPDFKGPPKFCPWCGHKIDTGALAPMESETGHDVPQADDLGVCMECAGLLVYVDNEGTARKMTPKDVAELDVETKARLIDTQLTVKAMRASGPIHG